MKGLKNIIATLLVLLTAISSANRIRESPRRHVGDSRRSVLRLFSNDEPYRFISSGLAATSLLETANPEALPEAKQVLNYIANLPGQKDNKVISGQFAGYSGDIPSEYERRIARLKEVTGKWPGLVGADYAYWGERPDHSIHNQTLIDYWKSGGLVTISWHAKNPWNSQDSSDRAGSSNLKEVITPGTNAYTAWISQLDWVAEGLAQLRDAGVVVLWRPLHEMNGSWFWWGGQDKEEYIALWQQMFDYFTHTKGLDNLLWVYSPNGVDGSWIKPAALYYPGDAYVDIVGLDKYGDDIRLNGYDEMIVFGKPFGLTEFGPGGSCSNAPCPDGNFDYTKLINRIRNHYPETSFFLAWGGDSPWAIVDNQNAVGLLNDPWVITREEIGWRPDGAELNLRVKQPEEMILPAYVEDEIIVKFKEGIAEELIEKFNQEQGTATFRPSKFKKFETLRIPEGKGVYEMAEIYARSPLVEYAEPNYIRHTLWYPNDPLYPYQWHFDDDHTHNPGGASSNPYGGVNGGGIRMEEAWPITAGSSNVVVAIIDTGVAYEDYPIPSYELNTVKGGIKNYQKASDLAGTSFWVNSDEIAGNGIDDDSNGYIDDLHGWDFVNDDAHPNDNNAHGTHVAGTITQATDNGSGVAGIAFNTTIMPIKVLNYTGSGTDTQVADGIYYAVNNGAKIINLSLGGSGSSTTLENAVAYAYTHGVAVVVAGGNEYEDGNLPQYPAAYDTYVMAVGATRYDETRSYYSNTGSYIDLVAPGGDVTVNQNEDTGCDDGCGDGILQQTFRPYGFSGKKADPTDWSFWFFQGTSMSAPHVSGVAALILALKPEFTPDQVRNALQSTAEDKGTVGRDDEYGWGIVDAYAALSSLVPSVSISLTTGGVIEFGTLALGATADTSGNVQTVLIETGPADLKVKSTVFADNGYIWTLGTTNGTDQAVWEFSPDFADWTIFAAADSLYSLASNVAQGATQEIYFRLTMPTETSSSNQYGAAVTIVAVSP